MGGGKKKKVAVEEESTIVKIDDAGKLSQKIIERVRITTLATHTCTCIALT